jgi:gas vesicle protein
MEESRGKTSVAAAFIIGGILGAGIALIFAPQSGEKTRRQIRRFGQRAINKAAAVQSELRDSIDGLVDDVTDKLAEEIERGREWSESRIKEVQRALESGRSYIREEIDKITRA